METFTLYVQTRLFQLESDIYHFGLAIVHCFTRDDEYIHGILRVNGISNGTTEAKSMAEIRTLILYTLAVLESCTTTIGSCVFNKTYDLVHNGRSK